MNDRIPHLNVHDAEWTPLPEFGGAEAILYRAPDNRRLAGSFKESGRHEMTMPYDEFLYVVAGEAKISVKGVGEIHLGPGDACYLTEGQDVVFDFSDDFHDVTMLASDRPISY